MVRPIVALFFATLVDSKIFLQTPFQVNNLGRNVEVRGISYFIPGWPEVRGTLLF
jgi:hypothetical protein